MGTKLVLLRHGESVWNLENRFTGWTDVELSELGITQSQSAGRTLARAGLTFDLAVSSVLKRAIRTTRMVLDEMDLMWIPEIHSWELNERHYGALQGLNKAETAAKYGAEQVYRWRRSFDVSPPPLEMDDPRHPRFDRRYAALDPARLPATESLQDTFNRVLPYWRQVLGPRILQGQRILVVAHGNSLRALVKHLDQISDRDIPALNIPLGIPLVYELGERLQVLDRQYLGEPEAVAAALETATRQARIQTGAG
jgi:2,3-bisphosphoglycerate-dependent phosphoglycerate mutase